MDMPKPPQLGCPVPLTAAAVAKPPIPSHEVRSRRAHLGYSAPGCTRGVAVDWSRVALFREAIASGTYELRPLRVAGSLIRFESSLYLRGRPHPITLSRGDCGDFASAEDLLDRVYELLCEESNASARISGSRRPAGGRQPEASDEGPAGGLPPAPTAR
jgi:anti-sigma28 factor (negative regulator of flagellin synthesis)